MLLGLGHHGARPWQQWSHGPTHKQLQVATTMIAHTKLAETTILGHMIPENEQQSAQTDDPSHQASRSPQWHSTDSTAACFVASLSTSLASFPATVLDVALFFQCLHGRSVVSSSSLFGSSCNAASTCAFAFERLDLLRPCLLSSAGSKHRVFCPVQLSTCFDYITFVDFHSPILDAPRSSRLGKAPNASEAWSALLRNRRRCHLCDSHSAFHSSSLLTWTRRTPMATSTAEVRGIAVNFMGSGGS